MEQNQQDAIWLKQIAQGDKLAFSSLLARYLNPILAFVRRYIPEHDSAEDITQEVFTRVWQHAGKWQQQDSSPRSWFYRIAYNLCIDQLRKIRPVQEQPDKQVCLQTPEDNVIQHAQLRQLQKAMSTLPERQRTALYLCTYQELSNREAAAIMDISIEALESLLSRARRTLRKQFQAQESQHYETA